jgi:hypothetical protein
MREEKYVVGVFVHTGTGYDVRVGVHTFFVHFRWSRCKHGRCLGQQRYPTLG